MSTEQLRVVDREAIGPVVRDVDVVGVLLAAGTSSRFGEKNKLLAEIDGEPLVRRAARSLLDADIDRVIVVVGYEADRVRGALEGLDVEFVVNEEFAAGQSTSVRVGVELMQELDVDAAVFALGDMPFVDPASINALVTAYRAGVADALAVAYNGTRGNPVLFDASLFDQLVSVAGDTGGRDILLEHSDAVLIETGDMGVLGDIDTVDDFERITSINE